MTFLRINYMQCYSGRNGMLLIELHEPAVSVRKGFKHCSGNFLSPYMPAQYLELQEVSILL